MQEFVLSDEEKNNLYFKFITEIKLKCRRAEKPENEKDTIKNYLIIYYFDNSVQTKQPKPQANFFL